VSLVLRVFPGGLSGLPFPRMSARRAGRIGLAGNWCARHAAGCWDGGSMMWSGGCGYLTALLCGFVAQVTVPFVREDACAAAGLLERCQRHPTRRPAYRRLSTRNSTQY
jgi:hypothetical protein